MRLCAYWDCMEEVDEGMSFCREHGRMLNRQLIDKCPKCGRYKDTRQKHCPDCNYGRPVADWKVISRNLDEVTEYVEPVSQEEPVNSTPVFSGTGGSQAPTRGEAMCPSCGSSSLTYKDVFDYYRCNDCETTFITPVYSYGESGYKYEAPPPQQPVNRQNVIEAPSRQPQPRREAPRIPPSPPPQPPQPQWREPVVQPQPVRWEEPAVQPQQPQWEEPSVPVKRTPRPFSFGKIPNLDIMRRHDVENRALNIKALKMQQGEGGKLGWVYLVVVLCIVALVALLGWVFFSDQISAAIRNIF